MNRKIDCPIVFISYSWDSNNHKMWVKELANSLLHDGIDVVLDQYDLTLGDRLPQFMEQSITNADYVLIICTPQYKQKADNRHGGVGFEGHIISSEIFHKHNEDKFLPVIREGSTALSVPTFLSGKLCADLSSNSDYETNYRALVARIYGEREKPPRGEKPAYLKTAHYSDLIPAKKTDREKEEPVRISGIIKDEVSVPKMDGTRGSALYQIPFRLSRAPSRLWCQLFIENWNHPPKFTTMHRPGIASVNGDKIILTGTTIEEVRQYHRDTLILCVDMANEQEKKMIEAEQQEEENERRRIEEHKKKIASLTNDIVF